MHDRIGARAVVVAARAEARAPEHRKPRGHHDRRGQRRRHRADQDVAVLHVRQLVTEHAFQLIVREDSQNPFGGGDRRVLRVAAGRERIRRRLGNDVDARHRQTGASRQLADDPRQPMLGTDFLSAVRVAGRSCPKTSTTRGSSRRRRRSRTSAPVRRRASLRGTGTPRSSRQAATPSLPYWTWFRVACIRDGYTSPGCRP